MTRVIDESIVEPATRVLLGAVDVDGGATDEQHSVIAAIVSGYWGRPDLDIDALEPLDPNVAATAIPLEADRHRVRELMVLLELSRHPISDTQVQRVDAYAAALGESGPGLALARTLVYDGAEQAMADYSRYLGDTEQELAEPSLREAYTAQLAAPDPDLAARLRALHNLPVGTLGYEYVEFYRRNSLTLPGDDTNMPSVFVAHDMCHVIAGYEPTGQGEIALGAMQLALTDTHGHWMQFLGNLAVHEAGFLSAATVKPKTATLTRPGAIEMLARALWRGSQCTGDFTSADHLGMAHEPLTEVRTRFGVPPLEA